MVGTVSCLQPRYQSVAVGGSQRTAVRSESLSVRRKSAARQNRSPWLVERGRRRRIDGLGGRHGRHRRRLLRRGRGCSCGVPPQAQGCIFWQCCLRLGFGDFAGIGANGALAVNNSAPQSGWSCPIGVAGEAGAGGSSGGGLSTSSSSVGGSLGYRPGVGYGFWAGLEVCCTKLKCAC